MKLQDLSSSVTQNLNQAEKSLNTKNLRLISGLIALTALGCLFFLFCKGPSKPVSSVRPGQEEVNIPLNLGTEYRIEDLITVLLNRWLYTDETGMLELYQPSIRQEQKADNHLLITKTKRSMELVRRNLGKNAQAYLLDCRIQYLQEGELEAVQELYGAQVEMALEANVRYCFRSEKKQTEPQTLRFLIVGENEQGYIIGVIPDTTNTDRE